MQRQKALFAALLLSGAVAAQLGIGCAGNSPINVDQSHAPTTPPASPTPPSFAQFVTDVEPFIDAAPAQCGQSTGCHASGTANGNPPLVLAVGDTAGNYAHIACKPRLTQYNPPQGQFINHFCTSATSGLNHSGDTATGADCTKFYNWAMTGAGTPPNCP